MCGIAGVHRFGDEPINRDMVDLLVLHNQNRGTDAAGVALQQPDGDIFVCKKDVTPYEFVVDPVYKKFMDEHLKEDTVTAICHTRRVTKGSPIFDKNNHPMWSGTTAVVHNGQIHNDDTLFKELNLERKAETDSDIIRAILDANGLTRKSMDLMQKCHGNAAFAAISKQYPGKLLLARSGNPLELAATKDHIFFSSEKSPIYQALRPYKSVYGIPMRKMTPIPYYMIGMNDHTSYLFAERPAEGKNFEANWLEWHQEFKIAYSYSAPNYQCQAQYFGQRVKFYDDRPIDLMECPKCGAYLNVAPSQLKQLTKMKCGICKTVLWDKEKK